MKYEWRKAEKELYIPKTTPALVTVGPQKFFAISGAGNPNSEDFGQRVSVLYSLSYAIRMMPKGGFTPEGYFEYTVYPLEGVWDLSEKGQADMLQAQGFLNKDELLYTVMIRQPEFVTDDVVARARAVVAKKKPHPLLDEAVFTTSADGLCTHMLHIGSYDDEPASMVLLEEFIASQGLERKNHQHREIYLSDPGKVAPEKLKTVLRVQVG